ncbi:hypothetical protein [Hypnocyclicus thermotrophus]|nr:hypothetical protein [Hypnocyclicus thermotrophus]
MVVFRTPFSKDIFMIVTSFILIKRLKRKSYFKLICYTLLMYSILHIILYILNILPDKTLIEYEINGKVNIRKSLGFLSVNAFPLLMFFLYIGNTLRTKVFSKSNFIIILLIFIVVAFTKTRTIVLVIIIMNIIYFILKITNLKNNIIKFVLKINYFLFGLLTMYIGLTYKLNGILFLIDNILSYRLRFWKNMFSIMDSIDYLKGHDIYSLAKKMHNPIDNSYIYSIFGIGILFFLVYSILYYKLLEIMIEEKKYKEITVVTIFIVYSFVENIYFYAIFNPTFLYMIDYFITDKKGKENEGDFNNNTNL